MTWPTERTILPLTEPGDELELLSQRATELGAPGDADVRRVHADVGTATVSGLQWAGPPVEGVFLHGGGQNAHTWDTLLLQRPIRALALDLPGHGWSSWLEGSAYRPRDLAPLVADAIASLAPAPRVVVGVSLGGLTALRMATTHPRLVSRLVLIDVSPGSTPDRVEEIDDFMARDDFATLDEMVDHAIQFRPGVPRQNIDRSVRYNARLGDDGRWSWRHDRRETRRRDRMAQMYADLPTYWDDVAALTCPTLLVRGGRSRILTPEDVDTYRRLLPAVEVVEFADAGHMVQSDAPVALGDLIRTFAARC